MRGWAVGSSAKCSCMSWASWAGSSKFPYWGWAFKPMSSRVWYPTVLVYKMKGAIKHLPPPPSRTQSLPFPSLPVPIRMFLLALLFSFAFVHPSAHVWFSIPPSLLFGFRFELPGDEMKGVVAMRKEIRVPEASTGRRCRFHKSSKKF